MIGMSTLHATSAKCFATASELIFGMRGGLIITAEAPAAFARFVYSRHGQNPSAVVPATTGTRPFTCVSTVSSARSRSASVSRATSLVTPSAVNPFTPSARNRSTTRFRLSGSNSPDASKGVGRTENTPPKAAIGRYGRSIGKRVEQRADLPQEQVEQARLCEKRVAAGGVRRLSRVGHRRQGDDGNVLGHRRSLEPRRRGPAVEVRHREVHDDHVGHVLVRLVDGALAVPRRAHVAA